MIGNILTLNGYPDSLMEKQLNKFNGKNTTQKDINQEKTTLK